MISGAYDIVIAAGVESMGRVPMGSSVLPGSDPFGAMAQRYPDGLVPQGISAELIAAKWGLSRQQLDEFSAGSHERRRGNRGRFDNELAPIAGLATDEIIRPGTTVETLAGLKPAFYNPAYELVSRRSSGDHRGQLVTAVGWQCRGAHHDLRGGQAARPATAGPHPHGHRRRIGPAVHADRCHPGHREGAAARRAHARRHRPVRGQRGVRAGRAELDKTPAPTWRRRMSTAARSPSGIPLGASGVRIMTTMVNALEQRGGRYALQTMCEAGGMANATIIERL